MALRIGSVSVGFPVMNASGAWCTTKHDLQELASSQAGAVVTKSMTMQPRVGNEPPKLSCPLPNTNFSSINSNGLENLGVDAYVEIIKELKKQYPHKPFIASIAAVPGELPVEEQYRGMVRKMEKVADAIELNLSCPNLKGKPIISYQPQVISDVLKVAKPSCPWSIKLPPYNFDLSLFHTCAEEILKFKPDALVTINSNPNCLDIDVNAKKKVIRPNQGYGGLGGAPVLQQALAEVNRWFGLVKEKKLSIPVVGVGGVTDTISAVKHFMAGASGIQVGSWYVQDGVKVFSKLHDGLDAWLAQNGCSKIDDIIGIVQEL